MFDEADKRLVRKLLEELVTNKLHHGLLSVSHIAGKLLGFFKPYKFSLTMACKIFMAAVGGHDCEYIE
jgi:hypothetical protein